MLRRIGLAGTLVVESLILSVLYAADEGATAEAVCSTSKLKCTSLIVGRDASSDGSVLLGHNEDLNRFSAQQYIVVPRQAHKCGEVVTLSNGAELPQVKVTHAYIATTIFEMDYVRWDVTSGMNEYQVSIANNAATQRDATYPCPIEGRITWSELSKLALERATTARQAVRIIGQLARAHKLGLDPGTMFGVTDPNEGWWIEIAQEGQWVAQRVPDDAAEMRANTYRIDVVDFNDPENFMHSDDVVSYAKSQGWYDGSDGPFRFAAVYGDPKKAACRANTRRHRRVGKLLARYLPAVEPRDVMTILRDHYEGTKYHLSGGCTLSSPHRTPEYTVCNLSTQISVVCQARHWLPAPIGGLCWRAMATPCSSVFIPWYAGHLKVPAAYQVESNSRRPGAACRTYRRLSRTVDRNYEDAIGTVRGTWEKIETQSIAEQQRVEAAALALYQRDVPAARQYLTNYSNGQAVSALKQARVMSKKVASVAARNTLSRQDAAILGHASPP